MQELLVSFKQAHSMIPNHNLSRGLITESILRQFLKTLLPSKVKVSQGFVEYNGALSNQCDIILYDHMNYAPLYCYGDIEVVPTKAVFAVIEVKTKIDARSFGNVLYAFDKLNELKVNNKYLFIYEGCKITTIEKYFYGKYVPQYNREYGMPFYDYDNYYSLPNAIVSLSSSSSDYYLSKGQVQTDSHDMMGYISYSTKDNFGKQLVCLQMFICSLLENITPSEDIYTILNLETSENTDIKMINVKGGFGLFYI